MSSLIDITEQIYVADHLADKEDIEAQRDTSVVQRKLCCGKDKFDKKTSMWVGIHKQYITRPNYVENAMVDDIASFMGMMESICLRGPQDSHGLSNFGEIGDQHGFEIDPVTGVCNGLVRATIRMLSYLAAIYRPYKRPLPLCRPHADTCCRSGVVGLKPTLVCRSKKKIRLSSKRMKRDMMGTSLVYRPDGFLSRR